MRRPYSLSLAALVAGLALLVGCKKKPADSGDAPPNAPPGAPGTPGTPAAADYLLFAHLNARDVRDSALVKEFRDTFAKSGPAEWDVVDGALVKEIGVKLTAVDALTVCATEIPDRGEPHLVMILVSNAPIGKTDNPLLKGQSKADARGFVPINGGRALVHFPYANTMAVLHPALADRYLDGYAKARTGWPFTADLSRAAATGTLFVSANLTKLPPEALRGPDVREFGELAAARTLSLTATLKGKVLSATARATYDSPAAAAAAKDKLSGLMGQAGAMVKELAGRPDLGAVAPLVKEAERTMADARLAVNGSDLTLSASYKADFDMAAVMGEAVANVREAAARTKVSNNLKQIGLALHNYHDSVGVMPVFGTGPKGVPLKGAPNEKALLSWRVAVLPYLEQDALYRQFKLDEPWDSDHNKKLIEKMPAVFAPVSKPGKPGHTHFQMVVGPGGTPVGARLPGTFLDGTANTLAVVEAADPVIWTKPADLEVPLKYAPGELKKRFGGEFPGGFLACFWDGSVRFVSLGASERTLGLMCHPSDGTVLPSDAFAAPPPPKKK